jgi:hypothetical protein
MSGRAKKSFGLWGICIAPAADSVRRHIRGRVRRRIEEQGPRRTLPARTPTGHIDDHERRGPFAGEGQVDRKREPARQRDTA